MSRNNNKLTPCSQHIKKNHFKTHVYKLQHKYISWPFTLVISNLLIQSQHDLNIDPSTIVSLMNLISL